MAVSSPSAIATAVNQSLSTTSKALTDLGFTLAQVEQASDVMITVATNSVRVTFDGEDASDTLGHLYATGTISLSGWELIRRLKIASTSSSTLNITLLKK